LLTLLTISDAIESATLDIKLTKQMATIECNIRSILLGLSCVQEGVVDELIWGRQKHLHPRKMLQDMRGLPLASPCAVFSLKLFQAISLLHSDEIAARIIAWTFVNALNHFIPLFVCFCRTVGTAYLYGLVVGFFYFALHVTAIDVSFPRK